MTSDSADIHYTVFSPAEDTTETILFIHGLGLDLTTWERIVPYFQSRYRIILYDLRGHGKSGNGTRELSWELLCQDVYQLVTDMNIKKLHMIGHGLGGNLCLQLALRYPSMVQSTVLIGTVCYYPKGLMQKHISARRYLANENSFWSLANDLVQKICYPPETWKRELLLQAYQKVSPDTYFSFLDLASSFLNSQIISFIQTPVLLLAGQYDATYPPNVLILGASFLPRSQFLVVPSASNTIQLDQPQLAAEWIEQFFRQVEQKPVPGLAANDWSETLNSELQSQIQQVISQGYQRMNTVSELRIELLHAFRVLIDGEEVHGSWNQRHAKELLAYLAIHKAASREQFCKMFWPYLPMEKARNNLRVALSHLKSLLCQKTQRSWEQHQFLLVDRELIRLQGRISCDLVDLKTALDQAADEPVERVKLTLCKKIFAEIPYNLLPGFDGEWVLDVRQQLKDRIVGLCVWAAEYCERQRNFSEGIAYLNIALRYDPNHAQMDDRLLESYQKNKTGNMA
ncbi:alpha/beta fold hydrolase [Brevibacillus sp. H7]|uniref:alpha/beta fold hydrolase n=1 Tax=Brevibacillus sp. H7 TaxID=3349138 RepID=UPI0038154685